MALQAVDYNKSLQKQGLLYVGIPVCGPYNAQVQHSKSRFWALPKLPPGWNITFW